MGGRISVERQVNVSIDDKRFGISNKSSKRLNLMVPGSCWLVCSCVVFDMSNEPSSRSA